MSKVIVGGLPEPIGGVTSFLRRLLHRDAEIISLFLDIYPGIKDPIRSDCQGKVRQLHGKAGLLAWLWFSQPKIGPAEIYFNFSGTRSLVLFLLCPRPKSIQWSLMLHHGSLTAQGRIRPLLYRVAIRRFAKLRYLSRSQLSFYTAMGARPHQLEQASSYCSPSSVPECDVALRTAAYIRTSHSHIVVMSGFPRSEYNFDAGIAAVRASGRQDVSLCIFIYGEGPLRDSLLRQAAEIPWLRIFEQKNESFFTTFLRSSDLLMRLNDKDSLGIAAWDAAEFGVPVIATDVCPRPDYTRLISSAENGHHIMVRAIKDLGK